MNKDRPYVICHMIPSLDGKIVMPDWKLPRAADADYDTTAATFRADAWMVGRISMEPYAGGRRPAGTRAAVPKGDFVAPHRARTFAIALDPSGRLVFKAGDIDGEHVIAVVTGRAPKSHLAYLRSKGVSYIVAGAKKVNLALVLRKLRRLFGIRKLLLEGGGTTNGGMLRAGLIDELSILVAPVADGRVGVPTAFDSGKSKASVTGLRLLSHKARPFGLVWLRYKVLPNGARRGN